MAYTNEEYQVYLKVQHELLLEDARNFIADAIASERGIEPEGVDEEELDKFDYEGLVNLYERWQDCNVAFNDTWESIAHDEVRDYFDTLEWFEDEEDEDD